MKVRKAVIAAAGFGTRFLPQTKAMPKEMLPIIDKPIIQRVVEELVEAGIEDIIIVTGYAKRSIEDHFDKPNGDLAKSLVDSGKDEALQELNKIANLANFAYVRQKGPTGYASPILDVINLIGAEPFIYGAADDFIEASPVSRFRQMIDHYEATNLSTISCVRANLSDDYKRYAYVQGKQVEDGVIELSNIVEKPGSPEVAQSELASVSSYLFTPEFLRHLTDAYAEFDQSSGGEFMLQPIMQRMIESGGQIHALEIQNGKYCDTGNKLEYLKTVTDFALRNPEIGADYLAYLKTKVTN